MLPVMYSLTNRYTVKRRSKHNPFLGYLNCSHNPKMGCLYSFVFAISSLIGGGPAHRIRIIDEFVGIIIRTIDLLLENKNNSFKK